ncbi:MAG: Ger(x)C family spore germination protein [Anaeromicrobium sp.]|jgi:spore germination protein KC|uniref:Ger(x)C family spore germination protein n=1 Tax=Anaeromicrobium sp. TaxID=1929132 RepID=UPI0025D80171|nr:Ger(x)C family spore germination protein [Anaeromicrobium sp.]MCT4594535.1 Ger(x)C family spore germination protein [Anaeromicrobium sp.]
MKKIIILIIISTLLTGCWNYIEIDDVSIVMGIGLDYDENSEEVILTTEIAKPVRQQGGTIIRSQIIKSKGKNMTEAIRNLVKITGREIFWGHTKMALLGPKLIGNKEKFMSCVDYMKRSSDFRDNIWLVMAEENSPFEILSSEKVLQNILSFQIEDTFKNEKEIAKYKGVELYDFVDKLATKGTSPILPLIKLEEGNKGKEISVRGTAIFKDMKYIGKLDGEETKYLLFILNKLDGGLLNVDLEEKDQKATLEIYSSDTKLKANYEDKRLSMDIHIKTVVDIANINKEILIDKEEVQNKIKKKAQEEIVTNCEKVIELFQDEYKSDNLGFSYEFKKEYPKVWKELENNWNEVFSNMEVKISSHVVIQGSALRSGPIKVVR